jgi:hypothetical protein
MIMGASKRFAVTGAVRGAFRSPLLRACIDPGSPGLVACRGDLFKELACKFHEGFASQGKCG